jgi:hypothetical protein
METTPMKSLAATMGFFLATASLAAWQPVPGHLMTTWGAEITPENAWREYPRPAFERAQWDNLNGLWNYAIGPGAAEHAPDKWDGQILVPFAVEASLSGVGRPLQPDEALWYRRTFHAEPHASHRTLLHFEAVDYAATVWVNGVEVGAHRGGGPRRSPSPAPNGSSRRIAATGMRWPTASVRWPCSGKPNGPRSGWLAPC